MSFVDLSTPAGLKAFDDYIATKRYIQGYLPTTLDVQALSLFKSAPAAEYTHALRYYNHISQFSDADKKSFRAGADVPAQIAGPVKAAAVASATPAPAPAAAAAKSAPKASAPATSPAAPATSPSANPAEVAALEEEIKKQGEVVRDLKAKKVDKSQLQPEIDKLLALKSKLTSLGGSTAAAPAAAAPAPAAAEKKETKKEEKKQDKKEEKKQDKKEEKKQDKKEEKKQDKKEEKKEAAAPAPGGYDAKLVAAVKKEGGKKGQDIIGVYEMGGLEFFCTTVDTPDGDIALVNMCLDAMNAEINPTDEEKRGGSASVGKMIFSAGAKVLSIVARVPEDKAERVNMPGWLKAVAERVGGTVLEGTTATYGQITALADPDKNRFTIKMKDEGIAAAVQYLQQRGCFPETKDESSEMVFGDDDYE